MKFYKKVFLFLCTICYSSLIIFNSFAMSPAPPYPKVIDINRSYQSKDVVYQTNRVSLPDDTFCYLKKDNLSSQYNFFFVSSHSFQMGEIVKNSPLSWGDIDFSGSSYNMISSSKTLNGYHYLILNITNFLDVHIIGQYFLFNGEYPWDDPGFILGQGAEGGGGSSSSVSYDSTIPAPSGLKFESTTTGGFLGIGSKFTHKMTWDNAVLPDNLYTRISALVSLDTTAEDQRFEDTLSLLPAVETGGYLAHSKRYSVTLDELVDALKISGLNGMSLAKVLEYRVQFYRYDEGVLKVGPVSTIRLKTNMFGKYDGYTVTTERPRDENELGPSAGEDDFYDDNWSSDGEHYDDYDKDGNLIGSGDSEDDGNPLQKLLHSLASIPKIINSFFESLVSMMSGVGQIPAYLSQLFSFLPAEIISLVGLGVLLVICLRILGR